MSTLRDQLDQARDAYHQARYPGDLASELLTFKLSIESLDSAAAAPRAVGRLRWAWAAGTASAAAAALVAAFVLSSGTSDLPFGTPQTGNGVVAFDEAGLGVGGWASRGGRPSLSIEPGLQLFATPRGWDALRGWDLAAGNTTLIGAQGTAFGRDGADRRGDGLMLVDFPTSSSAWTSQEPLNGIPADLRWQLEQLSLQQPLLPRGDHRPARPQ